MADELNGTDVLLQVETSPGSGSFLTIGSQRGVTFNETTAAIDFSSKDARAGKFGPGRYGWTAELENLYTPNLSGYSALRTAMRDGTLICIKRREQGANVESGYAVVTQMSDAFPDQDAAVCSVSLQGSGRFNPTS
jgi:predicted secreted protein